MKNSILLILMFTLFSCQECEYWQEKAQSCYQKNQILFKSNSGTFDDLKVVIDSLINNNLDSLRICKDISYSVYSNKRSDDQTKKQSDRLNALLSEIGFNELVLKARGTGSFNVDAVLYPNDTDVYNEIPSCPSFSFELWYRWDLQPLEITSPNFRVFKLDDHWYIRASTASL